MLFQRTIQMMPLDFDFDSELPDDSWKEENPFLRALSAIVTLCSSFQPWKLFRQAAHDRADSQAAGDSVPDHWAKPLGAACIAALEEKERQPDIVPSAVTKGKVDAAPVGDVGVGMGTEKEVQNLRPTPVSQAAESPDQAPGLPFSESLEVKPKPQQLQLQESKIDGDTEEAKQPSAATTPSTTDRKPELATPTPPTTKFVFVAVKPTTSLPSGLQLATCRPRGVQHVARVSPRMQRHISLGMKQSACLSPGLRLSAGAFLGLYPCAPRGWRTAPSLTAPKSHIKP